MTRKMGKPDSEFPQLAGGNVYADWTGAALWSREVVDRHQKYLLGNPLGNPHSEHDLSRRAMKHMDKVRGRILRWLRADPREYDVVFTSGATGAILKLRDFAWTEGELLLCADNHNAVHGLREAARAAGARVRYVPLREGLTVDEVVLREMLESPASSGERLFGFTAKSNFSGVKHPLEWIALAQKNGWRVLLDAAAFFANDRLDLSKVKPDFVPISFYKVFGYPTGVGCLVVRRSAYPAFAKTWFAGGSIKFASVGADFFAHDDDHAGFEDGTPAFSLIPAVKHGLDFMDHLGDTGPAARKIAGALRDRLLDMGRGDDCVLVYSPSDTDIVTFNIQKQGKVVDAARVAQAAKRRRVCVRDGCFCNPGAGERALPYAADAIRRMFASGIPRNEVSRATLLKFTDGQGAGAIRASFGYANHASDALAVADLAAHCLRYL